MSKFKKTFKHSQIHKFHNLSQNKFKHKGKNIDMKNIDKEKTNQCNVYVMPSAISDNDISALFQGLLNVVKKKFELDSQAEFYNYSQDITKLKNELKIKNAECNRLKNEIINLKNLLNKNNQSLT